MTTNNDRVLYQLKVTLLGIDPPIWQRIQIGEDATRKLTLLRMRGLNST
jgi:hypothetical protein